jgi:hypothetical protein
MTARGTKKCECGCNCKRRYDPETSDGLKICFTCMVRLKQVKMIKEVARSQYGAHYDLTD